jgi:hypothetical protein
MWKNAGDSMKRALLIGVLLLLIVPTAVARPLFSTRDAGRTPSKHHRPVAKLGEVVPNWKFFVAIGKCEQPAPESKRLSNGEWKKGYEWGIDWHQVRNGSFPGGLGIWEPLWHEEGIAGTDMAPTADKATPVEQMRQAQRIVNKYGKYAWGCTGVALAQARYIDVKS